MREQQPTTSDEGILSIITETAPRHCAWCLKEQGIPAGEESHGICGFHKAQILAQAASRKAARAAARRQREAANV